jgi:hypothetical protein
MVSLSIFGGSRSKTVDAKSDDGGNSQPPKESNAVSPLMWDYSGQYYDVTTDGSRKPPPSIGSPTFVWHIGIWRKVSEKLVGEQPAERFSEKLPRIHTKYLEHDEHNEKFFEEINAFVKRLQESGRVLRKDPSKNIDEFKFQKHERRLEAIIRDKAGLKNAHAFKDYEPQSLAFTLWWSDSLEDNSPVKNSRSEAPAYSAIRVRVQILTHAEHVTLSFYIDAAKPHGHPQIYRRGHLSTSEFGYRRDRIAKYLETLRRVGDEQIQNGLIERDRLPERGINESDAAALQEIAGYFCDGIWCDFMKSFGISAGEKGGRILLDIVPSENAESEGEIFMDYRGLVMAVNGLDTPANVRKEARADRIRNIFSQRSTEDKGELAANQSFGTFPRFDPASNEPGIVLKAWWPFIRRVVPWADYRDIIGCGITEWRSLYVNSLAASGAFYGDDESVSRAHEVPNFREGQEGQSRNWSRRPVNYLVLTKGEPHREQLGRFVERINALATTRLFALKNLRTIKNAGTHIKLLGQELDGVLEYWGEERKRIEEEYYWKLVNIYYPNLDETADNTTKIDEGKQRGIFFSDEKKGQILEKIMNLNKVISAALNGHVTIPNIPDLQKVPESRIQRLQDWRVQELASLVKRVERRLVEIGSALDNIGNGGSGRLLFVINRAKVQMEEFERMWPSLEIGNVDGWATYGQFVQRAVLPTFDLIRSTGDRLISLRQRLQSITAMIQTSALIIESEETRSNTAILRRISSNLYFVGTILSFIIAGVLIKDTAFPILNARDWIKIISAIAIILYFGNEYLRKKQEEKNDKRTSQATTQMDALRLLLSFWR